MTQNYVSTKIVLAWNQTHEDGRRGYGVRYEDGYTSWSPKEAFEKCSIAIGHVDDKPPFLQRMIGEFAQLVEKREKLKTFIEANHFKNLPIRKQRLLEQQLVYMEGYLAVLGSRIELEKQ